MASVRFRLADYLLSLRRTKARAMRSASLSRKATSLTAKRRRRRRGRTVSDLIRRAREDERIKALVMRVDSPGGMTSLRDDPARLEVTRAPASRSWSRWAMPAASGGYGSRLPGRDPCGPRDDHRVDRRVSRAAERDKAWEKLGIHTGGITTTWLAGAGDPRRPLDKRVGELLQSSIDNNYRRFVGLVAQSRNLSQEQVENIAQGRVWTPTGTRARTRRYVWADSRMRSPTRPNGPKLGDDYSVL